MPTTHKSPDCGSNRRYIFRSLKRDHHNNTTTIKFRVKASGNVNICLSPSAGEVPHQQYEIFLSGWDGKQSAIRRNKQDDVAKVQTRDILNKNFFRAFWITITNHDIKVGKDGFATPFLSHYEAPTKINVAYYGYCTSFGSTGEWTFGDDEMFPSMDMNMRSVGSAIDDMMKATRSEINERHSSIRNSIHPTMVHPTFVHPSPPMIHHQTFPHHHVPPQQQPPPATQPTAPFYAGPSMQWVQCKSAAMCPAPVRALPGGHGPYIGLAYHKGGLMPGVVMPPNDNVCHIPWGGNAIAKTDFFILSNPGNIEVIWQPGRDGHIPVGALQGGYSEHKEPLYIGRINRDGVDIVGKVHQKYRLCYAPYWGKEISESSYDVLCLRTIPMSLLGL